MGDLTMDECNKKLGGWVKDKYGKEYISANANVPFVCSKCGKKHSPREMADGICPYYD
jgi:hypothetical protein